MDINEIDSLAKDPQAFDARLADLHTQISKARAELARRINEVHKAAGDHQRWMGNSRRWTLSYADAYSIVRDQRNQLVLNKVEAARHDVSLIELEIQAMDEAYTGWTRFFPSVTKSQPHIHRSLDCRTLHATTVMRWEPALSGHTDAEAVAKLDERLCSVCFPGAPVALHNYVSRRSQAEQAERQAAKNDRAAKALAKNLDGDQIFRSRTHDHITTVAACKELIRRAVELVVECEWMVTPAAHLYWTDPQDYARVLANRQSSASQAEGDAQHAAGVLIAREAAHEGHGATVEAIEKMRANKLKSARKEWGL